MKKEEFSVRIVHSGEEEKVEVHTLPIYYYDDYECSLTFDEFCKAIDNSRYERIISKLNLSIEQREIFESLSNNELYIICSHLWKKD